MFRNDTGRLTHYHQLGSSVLALASVRLRWDLGRACRSLLTWTRAPLSMLSSSFSKMRSHRDQCISGSWLAVSEDLKDRSGIDPCWILNKRSSRAHRDL